MITRSGRWAAAALSVVAVTVLFSAQEVQAQNRRCPPCMCMGAGMSRMPAGNAMMMQRTSPASAAPYAMQLRQQQAALLTAMQGRQQPNALWWPAPQGNFNPWAPAVPQQQNAQLRAVQAGK